MKLSVGGLLADFFIIFLIEIFTAIHPQTKLGGFLAEGLIVILVAHNLLWKLSKQKPI